MSRFCVTECVRCVAVSLSLWLLLLRASLGIYFQVVEPDRRLTEEQWDLEAELGIAQVESGIVYR